MLCLRQIKNYLNVSTNQDDEVIREMFNYTIGAINNYCLRTFELEERIDILQGNGRAFLPTPLTPIKTITEMKINGLVVNPVDYSIRNKMVFYPKYFPVKYLGINENWTPKAYLRGYNVELTYSVGYVYPQWVDVVNESDVPKELQFVALEILKAMYIASGVQAQEQTKTVSTVGESLAKQYFKQIDKFEFTPTVKAILDKYKKVGVN